MKTHTYTVLYEHFEEDGEEGYHVVVPALFDIVTWGKTIADAQANAEEAIRCHLAGLILHGDPLPVEQPHAEMARIERVSVPV